MFKMAHPVAAADLSLGSCMGPLHVVSASQGCWLGSEAEDSNTSRQMFQSLFLHSLGSHAASTFCCLCRPARRWAGGMGQWTTFGNKLSQSPSSPFCGDSRASEASQKEKKRVKMLLHVASNGPRMTSVTTLVPERVLLLTF